MRLLAIIGCLATLLFLPRPPTAAKPAETNALVKRMVQQFNQGNYRGAIDAAKRLYRLSRNAQYLANIGRCYQKLGDKAQAITYYRRFLVERPTAPNHAAVAKAVQRLHAELSLTMRELSLHSSPPGATVIINGKSRPSWRTPLVRWFPFGAVTLVYRHKGYRDSQRRIVVSPGPPLVFDQQLEPLPKHGTLLVQAVPRGTAVYLNDRFVGKAPLTQRIKAGTYVVALKRDGYQPYSAVITIVDAKTTLLKPQLQRVVVAIPPPRPRRNRRKAFQIAAWTLLGSGVALLGAGTGLQVWAKKSETNANNFKKQQELSGPVDQTVVDAYNAKFASAKNRQKAATALFVVGGACVVTSVVLFFVQPKAETQTVDRRISWGPLTGSGFLGLYAAGRF